MRAERIGSPMATGSLRLEPPNPLPIRATVDRQALSILALVVTVGRLGLDARVGKSQTL
jgi:hypothetical protein